MADKPNNGLFNHETPFSRRIGAKETRKLRAQRYRHHGVWFGLGSIGVIGWSVALPAVLGAVLGIWLDQRYPGKRSWTLMLLVIGLALGCWNAARWVAREQREIRKEEENFRHE